MNLKTFTILWKNIFEKGAQKPNNLTFKHPFFIRLPYR